jgi:hypothetical protein
MIQILSYLFLRISSSILNLSNIRDNSGVKMESIKLVQNAPQSQLTDILKK